MLIIGAFGLLVVVALIRIQLWIAFVDGQSMHPTLLDGDHIIVLRHWPTKLLQRRQVVVCLLNSDGDMPHYIVKRITGLPGDILVQANPPLPSSQLAYSIIHKIEGDTYRIWVIPPKHFFLKGDGNGRDSSIFGPCPFCSIRGLAVLRISNKPSLALSLIKTIASKEDEFEINAIKMLKVK